MQYNTGARCVVCGETVVAEVESVAKTCPENIPIGPSSVNYYRPEVTSIHCSNVECQLEYHQAPGKPNAAAAALEEYRKTYRD